jgi:hypothetical protein
MFHVQVEPRLFAPLVDVGRVFDGLDERRLANIAATLRAVRRGFLAAKLLAVGFVVLL